MPSQSRTSEKPLPQNAEAERSILGCILLDNAALSLAVKHISSGDFFSRVNQTIFRRMLQMSEAGQPIDLVTLNDALDTSHELREGTEIAYIASLADGGVIPKNVEKYATIVKQKAVQRRVMCAAFSLYEKSYDGNENLVALASQLSTIAKETPGQKIVGGNGHLTYSGREFLMAEFPVPEHLIEGLIPKNGSAMIIAMPHHLKTWFTLSLTMGATVAGMLMGKLSVPKPIRTLLVTVEDFPGDVQWRMRQLLMRETFKNVDLEGFRVLPRPMGGMDIMQESWMQTMLTEIATFKPDHVIFDVLRRIFRGDINSPKESSALCEQVDRIRDDTGVATTVVHHENRKGEDIMRASAGSFNFPGWANVLIRFQRKVEEVIGGTKVSHVEIEVDNKLASSPEPVRMILDLSSDDPVRLESLEDTAGVNELRNDLGSEWTVNDLGEVLGVHKSNAKRRLKKLQAANLVEKVAEGKKGRRGGLARYRFVGDGE